MANVRKNHTTEFKTKVGVEAIRQQSLIKVLIPQPQRVSFCSTYWVLLPSLKLNSEKSVRLMA